MSRRRFIEACAGVAWLGLMPPALAQTSHAYPSKTVRLVVPFVPGGATDIVARLLSQRLGELWQQSVPVENRAGAAGNIGADLVAKAQADGYTLLLASGSMLTANPHLYKALPYNAQHDLQPVTQVARGPMVLVVNPALPVNNLREFIALAKQKPGALSFGSAGVGSQVHLAAEQLAANAGIEVQHIPYRGAGQALIDLIGGQVQFMTDNLASSIGHITQGKLRALAVTSKARIAQLPNVPTVAESGLPGFEAAGWFGLLVPAATPKYIVAKLHADVAHVLDSPEMRGLLFVQGMVPVGNKPEHFARAIQAESRHMSQIIAERKIVVN